VTKIGPIIKKQEAQVQFPLCLTAYQSMKKYRVEKAQLHSFLSSALFGSRCQLHASAILSKSPR